MQWAPEPVALSHTVQPPSCPAVTIDVVGAGGRWWLEAKASLPFGLGSSAWIDLEQQLSRLTRSARASFCGTARPDVLVVFKHPCPAEVQSALIDISVTCITPHPDGSLPDPATVSSLVRPDAPTPLQPPCVLLDVSSLLCLISSACRASPNDQRLRAWAASNEHWLRSLDEEAEAPLLDELGQLLARHSPWLSANCGPREMRRAGGYGGGGSRAGPVGL
jgi:hypothetical protein